MMSIGSFDIKFLTPLEPTRVHEVQSRKNLTSTLTL